MLNFTNALIRHSLFLFTLSVTLGNAGVPVGRGMRVEHSDTHVGFSNLPPQKPLTARSSMAPSFVFEVEPVIISPVTG